MTWTIEFDPATERKLSRIPYRDQRAMLGFLVHVLATLDDPSRVGKRIRGSHIDGFFRYRIGRVRFVTFLAEKTILVLTVRVSSNPMRR